MLVNSFCDNFRFCFYLKKVFKKEEYLRLAVEASDVIWEKGLLHKGVGVYCMCMCCLLMCMCVYVCPR